MDKFKYRVDKNLKYVYIVAPQESGYYHIHILALLTSEYEYDIKIVKDKEARINEELTLIIDKCWEHGNIDVRLSDKNIKSYLTGNTLLDYDLEKSIKIY